MAVRDVTVKKLWYDRSCIPKSRNEKVIGAYLSSKKEMKELPKLRNEGYDFDRDVIASRYLAHKKLVSVEGRLKHRRHLALRSRKFLDDQWVDLQIKEEELRHMFIKFNGFIRENMEKRERAASKVDDQDQVHMTKIAEIATRTRDCAEMSFMYSKINEMVEMYWIFETFLQEVVNEYPAEFEHPMDVLKRYESLTMTKNILRDYQIVVMTNLHNVKTEYCKMIDGYCVKLAGLHTKLANLNQRYDSAKLNALKWEKLLLDVRSEAAEKIMDLTAIKESCTRMYTEICERKGIKPVYMNDYGKQFEVIKNALRDFECINNKVRALEEEKKTLSEKACVSSLTEWQ